MKALNRRCASKAAAAAPADARAVITKHVNAAAKKQRYDFVQATLDPRKSPEGKGRSVNAPETVAFTAARAKHGEEGGRLLQKPAGDIG